MAKVRVFENPDGSVQIVKPNPKRQRKGESNTDFETRIFTRTVEANSVLIQQMKDAGKPLPNPALAGLPFFDVEFNTLPTDREKRYAWRRQGGAVRVDPIVQPPPHPKQALLDDIGNATSVEQLKGLMTKIVRGT